jgi:ABC-2 type transport system ATP-binding protein
MTDGPTGGAGDVAVRISGLRREFVGKRRRGRPAEVSVALDGVSLTVAAGSVHGLLGPNGAGKTTLVKILSTILLPSGGTASVFGHDVATAPAAVRPLVGLVLGGERGLYDSLTARQNLRYWAALYGLGGAAARARTDELLDRLGLAGKADARVRTLSRGMKQRLHLARGLIGDSRLLIFDEPTVGMDPVAAKAFRELVRELRAEGRTILLTTHDMAEAEELCQQVTLIDGGRVIADETPRTLAGWLGSYEYVELDGAPAPVLAELERLDGVSAVTGTEGGGYRVSVVREGVTGLVLRHLLDAGVTGVRTGRPGLDEVYLHLVGDRGLEVR